MLFGIIYLLFCAYVIYKRSEIGNKMLFVLGLFMGAYFFWHIYISIMVLSALFFVLLFDKKRKKTGYLLIGYCLIFGGCFIYLKHILSNPLWFMTTGVRYPQLDLGFAAIGAKPGTLLAVKNMLQYYTFAYGLRGVMFFISIIILLKKDRRLLLVLLAFIVPTFILINTVKLSPNISENHKWLRPMDIIVDLTTAYIVYKGFFARRNYYIYSIGIICLFFLTISGIIELMPFLNSKPVKLYDAYPSSMSVAIQQYSTPKAVFVGKDNKEIHLAGRKMFVGASAGPDYALNKTYRETIIDNLYHTNDLQTFCHSIHDNNIDVVELDSQNIASLNLQKWFPFFTAQNSSNELVTFITTKQTCESL